MAYKTPWKRNLLVLVILNSQFQIIICQNQHKTTVSPPIDSPSATEKPGINLSQSFFLQRLRQGNFKALEDFNSLRQTLIIPENQQTHFNNFLQQQNPLNRFALWHTMQNGLVHGFPNSHALNRMGLPIANTADGQQMLPAQQYLNILQRNRGENQLSGINEPMPEMNAGTTSDNKNPDTSEAMVAAPVRSQINPNVQLTAAKSQLGQLGIRIRDVLRTKVNENALEDTLSLIEQVLKNRAASLSSVNGVDNTIENNADMVRLSTNESPNGFILQYVGDVFDPNFVNTYDMAPRRNGLSNKEIVDQLNRPQPPANDVLRTIQFVGNIFGNNGLKPDPGVNVIRGTENDRIRNNAIDPSVTGQLKQKDNFENSARTGIDANVVDSPNVQTSDIFLQFVGDLTGADLIGARSEISSLTGEINPRLTKLFRDSPSVGMRGNIISTSKNGMSPQETSLGFARQTAINVRNGDMAPLVNRNLSLYLQQVGNLLADQLTPVDGALTAFNETNLKKFEPSVMQNINMLRSDMVPVQSNRAAWPFKRMPLTQQRIANNLIGNRDQFQHRSNMNLAQILNRQQLIQPFRGTLQMVPTVNNRFPEESKNSDFAQITNQEGNHAKANKVPSADGLDEPDIKRIVELLRSLTNRNAEDSVTNIQQMGSADKGDLETHSKISSNKVPVMNSESDRKQINFLNVTSGQTSDLRNGGGNPLDAFRNTNDQFLNSAQSNTFRTSLIMNGLTNNPRDMEPTTSDVLPRTREEGQLSKNVNPNIINTRNNSVGLQMMPCISSAQTFQNILRTSANKQTFRTQSGVRIPTEGDGKVSRERHKTFEVDMRTDTPNPQREHFRFNGVNKTLTDQLGSQKTPKTGIETGFILVNRLFVTDNMKDRINTANKNGFSGSEIKTVIRRKEMDPRTGETVNIIVGATPLNNANKHTERRQAVKSNC